MIHKSWKRIEILNIIDKLGLDVKKYSYLNKVNLFTKFTDHIRSEKILDLEYLFKTKPIINLPMCQRSILTKKARKVEQYCNTLDLEIALYTSIIQVKEDVKFIQSYQFIPCVRKAIQSWNEISEEYIPYIQTLAEYDITSEEEILLKRKMKALTVKRGNFIIKFES
tara:strand:- start:191 stop:691 length:501 start_codon:yes stop_codon:yes gene_type:complete